MSTTNHPVIPEEIKQKIESAYPLTPNPTGDRHIKVFNMAQEESRINAGFGYSLALKVIEDQAKEIIRLKELLREVCVRANIIFPERENEIEMFEERFKGQHDLFINLNATLGLGEMDEESKIQNEKALKAIKRKHNL